MRNDSQVCARGIDVAREKVLSFAEAARYVGQLKGTKRLAFQTLHRWATKGCRRIVLETVFVGGARCTSKEALHRFFEGVTRARSVSGGRRDVVLGAASRGATVGLADVDDVLREAGIAGPEVV